ncbi:MAG: hypothetical protein WA151_14810 [Desulfatirhabdiaceae bacterium]
MPKTRINISLDKDIADFARVFAAENRTTVADLMTQYLLNLKRKVECKNVEYIFANPAFHETMQEALTRLQDGSAVWHTYNDVFPD